MRYILNIFLLLIFILSIFSCKKSSSVKKTDNYENLYNPASVSIHPVRNIYHINDSLSELTIKIFPDELLYNKANKEGVMRAYLSIKLEVTEILNNRTLDDKLTDSIADNFVIENNEKNKRFYISTYFKAKRGKKYHVVYILTDKNRTADVKGFCYVDKSDIFNEQNFKVNYYGTDQPVFNPKILNQNRISISHPVKTYKRYFVKYYKNTTQAAYPPYMVLNETDIYTEYDSLFIFSVDNKYFEPEKEGIYLFQLDTSVKKGMAVINFYDDFPKIEESEQMIPPATYLASETEYTELEGAKNKKMTVDDFWLNLTDQNTERSRQLIRIYYNRVFLANYYFTSFKQGWMTDRGMIYIIYGYPDFIYKDFRSENWVYYGKKNTKAVNFNFILDENPFGYNHYILQRGIVVNTYWKDAVQSWQSGNVFSIDNLFKK